MAAPKHVTLCQDGLHGDLEFVVAYKNRPFTILTSPSLPTPTVTLVDHKLVAELKIRMTDLQCTKLHFGGKKLRILGKISTSVQCIVDGMVSGNMHLKASVVQDLYESFDTHSIASTKLSQMMIAPSLQPSSDSDMAATEPTNPKPSKRKKNKKKQASSSSSSPSSPTSPKTPTRLPQPTIHTVSINQLGTRAPSPCLSPAWTPSHNTGWTPSPHTGWTPSPHTGWAPSPTPSHRSAMPTPTFQAITAKMTPDYRLLYSPSAPVSAAITSAKMSPDYSLLYSPTAPISAAVTSSKMSPDYTMSPPGFPYPRYDNTTRGNISTLPEGCQYCGQVCQVGHHGFGDGDYYG